MRRKVRRKRLDKLPAAPDLFENDCPHRDRSRRRQFEVKCTILIQLRRASSLAADRPQVTN